MRRHGSDVFTKKSWNPLDFEIRETPRENGKGEAKHFTLRELLPYGFDSSWL